MVATAADTTEATAGGLHDEAAEGSRDVQGQPNSRRHIQCVQYIGSETQTVRKELSSTLTPSKFKQLTFFFSLFLAYLFTKGKGFHVPFFIKGSPFQDSILHRPSTFSPLAVGPFPPNLRINTSL